MAGHRGRLDVRGDRRSKGLVSARRWMTVGIVDASMLSIGFEANVDEVG